MALSTMRLAMRPALTTPKYLCVSRCVPMATSAQNEMQSFWDKNQKLNRPNSPWVIYKPHLPMLTSLTHRITGITMGVALYGLSISLFLAPGEFATYIDLVKSFEINPALLFAAKTVVAFPLTYHYINGIRHLSWDAGYGYKLGTQYKTGWSILATSGLLAATLASLAYW